MYLVCDCGGVRLLSKRTDWRVRIAIFKPIQLMCVQLKIEVISAYFVDELIGDVIMIYEGIQ